MSQTFTKSMARNIFYGGSVFFFLLFLALTFDTMSALPQRDNSTNMSEQVVRGKMVWEENNCIGCHTLLGEGAYFAPELGNVMTRWGVEEGDHEGAFEVLKGWMDAMPTGIEGRRQMPNFGLTDDEYRALADFLLWTDTIRTQDWPPNDAG